MLFNSYEFIFLFLPLTVSFVFLANKYLGHKPAIIVLILASLLFYAQHKLSYIFIILFSIGFNFLVGRLIAQYNAKSRRISFIYAFFGVFVNLALLGYFKYADFFIANISGFLGLRMEPLRLMLPIGISFFTFQQIAYLVDVYKRISYEPRLSYYAFFVSFFPQLIAGPIVHHKELIPQIEKEKFKPFRVEDVALGLTIFFMGLGKKILIADTIAPFATSVFNASDSGIAVTFVEAWAGALAFTFQIYFDFSAYSEMAIGLALLFGLRLPVNFRSPYRARSMIEFWKRWHITLSTFLKDYLYIPLGGNRCGQLRKLANIMVVMLLGGFWHGANWVFIIWGGLHGIALAANHVLRDNFSGIRFPALVAWPFMFVYLTVTWVFFKAGSVGSAFNILKGMAGFNGVVIPEAYESKLSFMMSFFNLIDARFGEVPFYENNEQVMLYGLLLLIVWFFPSLLEWVGYDNKPQDTFVDGAIKRRFVFRFSIFYALLTAIVATLSIIFLYHGKVFLYFQF